MVSAHESPKPDGGKSPRGADIDGLIFESGRGDLLTGASVKELVTFLSHSPQAQALRALAQGR